MTRGARDARRFGSQRGRTAAPAARRLVAAVALGAVLVAAASPASADTYDPKRAGHPLRVFAYMVHPIGVLLDYALFRPAHWVVTYEPMKTIFGHTD